MLDTILKDLASFACAWSRQGQEACKGEPFMYRICKNYEDELFVWKAGSRYRPSWKVLLSRNTVTISSWSGDFRTPEEAIIASFGA